MPFILGQKSLDRLTGVHPDLVKVVKRAIEITEHDFSVIEGLRSIERQKLLMEEGATRTLNSKHIKQKDGFGHAVDLYPVGRPTPWDKTPIVAKAILSAAEELGVKVRWGGDWNMNGDSKDEKFYDSPHFELRGV
jgi:peptidoglycan L-alanyl-D-glutamate endopeptidase CwlK